MALLKQNEAGASPLITTAEAKKRHQMMSFSKNVWSGRQDLNKYHNHLININF
jgi:hypothetical protein